ncbi:phosphatidate cytidylyltransferase [candidate division FCPU426 bacterium]|nr:phosphatidate cytidylyltransferase [candidate division FCPU426 bacterium]
MLKTRMVVAAIFLPVFAWLIFLANPWPLYTLTLVALVIAMLEFGLLVEHRRIRYYWWVALPAALGLCAAAACSRHLPGIWPANALVLFFIISLLAMFLTGLTTLLMGYREHESFASMCTTFMSVVLLGNTSAFLFMLRDLPHGSYWWLILFGCNWLYDASAMFGGTLFGKRRLAPTISPAKTLEGMICGLVVTATAAAAVYLFWFPRQLGFSLPGFVLLSICLALLSQAGDLIESMFKRWSGAKDASTIIPGHGGILDKTDNLYFTAPLLFAVGWWMMHP